MSAIEPIRQSSLVLDLSPRFVRSVTVAASPSAAVETTIASITLPANAAQALGIELVGWAAYTVGTSGTAVNLRIRQTNTSGTIIAATGATTAVATNLNTNIVAGLDTAGVLPNQVYVLTMTVTAGAATSTVSAVYLRALIV